LGAHLPRDAWGRTAQEDERTLQDAVDFQRRNESAKGNSPWRELDASKESPGEFIDHLPARHPSW
jgi:hypothetical protein